MVLAEYEYADESGNGLFIQTKETLDRQNKDNARYRNGMGRLMNNNRVLRLPRKKVWDILPGGHDGMLRSVVEKNFNRGFKELSFASFK